MKNFTKKTLLLLMAFSAIIANAQVPKLSSNPSASAAIFLDFDGHTVAGTSWNVSGPIECGGSGLNEAQIKEIYNRVAEDYRPFNINVTTDSTKYWSAPSNKRMRVILTVSSSWYGSSGGVAYTNSFTWGDNTPCFVFSALLNNNIKKISEAAAHEVGHTLGLRHQAAYDANCVKTSDYNVGTGSGEIGWAPIMGVGYYQNLSQWHNGPSSVACTLLQDDLSIITNNINGFGYRTDDHGSTIQQATVAPFSNNQFLINGIIESPADQDLFKFSMTQTNRFKLSANPFSVGGGNAGSNMDIQVSLINGSQTVIGVYNPRTLLNSIIDTLLETGTYYIRVEGKGNTFSSGYASLGSYALQASYISDNTPPPVTSTYTTSVITLSGTLTKTKHNLSWTAQSSLANTSLAIESSIDGINFIKLAETSVSATNYSYTTSAPTMNYRLNLTFSDQSNAYSNIVLIQTATIGNIGTKGNSPSKSVSTIQNVPQLLSNLIITNDIKVYSPDQFNYVVFDLNGKTLNKGTLELGNNNITVNTMNSGIYMIQYSNGIDQKTEKFIKKN